MSTATIAERATATVKPKQPPRITCPCCEYTWEPGRPRSLPQHRRFHAICKAAFDNWPEQHHRQFATVNELRHWLTARSGHYTVKREIPLTGIRPELARMLAEAAMKAAGAHAIAAVHKGVLKIIVADSIRFDRMGPREFGQLCDDVTALIERETGINFSGGGQGWQAEMANECFRPVLLTEK
jgi:hypothetical protein